MFRTALLALTAAFLLNACASPAEDTADSAADAVAVPDADRIHTGNACIDEAIVCMPECTCQIQTHLRPSGTGSLIRVTEPACVCGDMPGIHPL